MVEFQNKWDFTLDAESYHARKEFLSSGALRALLRSPRHYHQRYIVGAKEKPSAAKSLGSLIHAAILEPERFSQNLKLAPKFDKRTKAGKEAWSEFQEKFGPEAILCEQSEYEAILGVLEAVNHHPVAKDILIGGDRECSGFFKLENGIFGKIRPDLILRDRGIILDVKTCADARRRAAESSIWKYRYDIQASWYLMGSRILEPSTKWDMYGFLFVEKEPPYSCAIYMADPVMLEIGDRDIKTGLNIYKNCLKEGKWPGYQKEPEMISVPDYARIDFEQAYDGLEEEYPYEQPRN